MRLLPRPQVFAVTILLLVAPAFAAAKSGEKNRPGKVDHALRDAPAAGGSTEHVIIRTKPEARAAIREALQAHGDRVVAEHASLSAISAEIHAEDIRALAGKDSILGISIDALVTSDAQPSGTANEHSSSLNSRSRQLYARIAKQVNRNFARTSGENLRATLGLTSSSPTGTGVVVAVIDSGIARLSDFDGRIAAFLNCTLPVCTPAAPFDDYGHGTYVAGLIGGSSTGVAPGAGLIGLKVLDATGQGRASDVIKALDWVRNNKSIYGIQVVNLSLGHPIFEPAETDPLVIAVQQTVKSGLKVTVAAGNFGVNRLTQAPGYAGITSPGNAPNAITVGALRTFDTMTRKDDRVAPYSSRGPTWYDAFLKPDLVAPGDALFSGLAPNSTLGRMFTAHGADDPNGCCYATLSGTSMATAVASGVVATVLDANVHNSAQWSPHRTDHFTVSALSASRSRPDLQLSALSTGAVKSILEFTAIPVQDDDGELYNTLTQGAGEINAGGAVSVAGSIDATKPVSQYWLTGWNSGDSFGQTTIGGETYAWAQFVLWDDNIVWGSGLVTYHLAAMDDNIVWGSDDNIVWGSAGADNIIWGSSVDDNIVWGSVAEWADNIVWGSNLIGMLDGDNIVWGSDDNIVWGSLDVDNIVWGTLDLDNIVWGSDDNVVWGS